MIKLREIKDHTERDFAVVWKIYRDSFATRDRRTLSAQRTCFENPRYKLYAVDCAGEVIGMLSVWEFDDFILVEHFAIKKQSRSKKVGSKVLRDYFDSRDTVFIAEVERPSNEEDARRMSFLKQLGVKLNRFKYAHPSYSDKKKELQFFLVSYPRKISREEYTKIRNDIYCEVFEC